MHANGFHYGRRTASEVTPLRKARNMLCILLLLLLVQYINIVNIINAMEMSQTLPGLPLKITLLPQKNAGSTYSDSNRNQVTMNLRSQQYNKPSCLLLIYKFLQCHCDVLLLLLPRRAGRSCTGISNVIRTRITILISYHNHTSSSDSSD